MQEKVELKVDGRSLAVTHIDKVLFPAARFTKAHIIDYYIKVSRWILPHLKDRPLTLKLYLTDVSGDAQYIKEAPASTPGWVKKAAVWRKSGQSQIHFVLVNDLPTLVWAANMNNLEMHTLLGKAPRIEQPLMMLFDLDPGQPASVLDCAQAALWLKEVLEAVRLKCFVKSSGSKGLQVCAPLNTPAAYTQTQELAKAVAEFLAEKHPELIVSEISKAVRAGKVFIDYGQNASYKSTVAVYSLRARLDGPYVSMPISWQDLTRALDKGATDRFLIEPAAAVKTCERKGDLFAEVLTLKQRLPKNVAELLAQPSKVPAKKRTESAPVPKLKEYRRKRDFGRTAEPSGGVATASRRAQKTRSHKEGPGQKEWSFVIQKHAASHLHYDFRLEMEGVLRSWAVPKGPPYTRGERRLAMWVEDHPLEYARFEGTIPAGQYGGGTVMVWDFGTYSVEGSNPVKAFYSGKIHMHLNGKKLKGEWALVRARTADEAGKEPWLLIKAGSNGRPLSRKRDDQSALTGRSMAQIAEENTAQWRSNRA